MTLASRGRAATLACALACAAATPALADSASFTLTSAWQKIASAGQSVEVQNNNVAGFAILSTATGGAPSGAAGQALGPGEHRLYTLAADLYASGTVRVVVTTGFSGGGGSGGGAIASNAPSASVTGSLSASGDSVALAVDGMNTGVVQIGAGAWSGTAVFEASADGGTTWVAVNMIPYAGGASTGSVTAAGLWEMAVGGLTNLRVRAATAIASGPAAVTLRATNGLKSIRVGNPAANPLTVTDPSNAAFSSATAMTAGTSVAAGRSIGINGTTAGTIVLTLSGGGTLTLPIALGWQTFPFAVTQFAFGSGGAGAVYNLN